MKVQYLFEKVKEFHYSEIEEEFKTLIYDVQGGIKKLIKKNQKNENKEVDQALKEK